MKVSTMYEGGEGGGVGGETSLGLEPRCLGLTAMLVEAADGS